MVDPDRFLVLVGLSEKHEPRGRARRGQRGPATGPSGRRGTGPPTGSLRDLDQVSDLRR